MATSDEKSEAVVNAKEKNPDFGMWFLSWLVVVALHVGMAYALARLEGASLARSGFGLNVTEVSP